MTKLYKCYEKVNTKTGDIFAWYGRKVSRHPWKFIVLSILVNSLLGIGLIRLDAVNDVEWLFTPKESQAINDRSKVFTLFRNIDDHFYPHNLANIGNHATIIIRPKSGNGLDADFMTAVKIITQYVKDTQMVLHGVNVTFDDVCVKRDSKCVVSGEEFLEPSLQSRLISKSLPFPQFGSMYLPSIFGSAKEDNGSLVSFGAYRLQFSLRSYGFGVNEWQDAFLNRMKSIQTNHSELAYQHLHSLGEELNANILGDVMLFAVTFTLMCTYAGLATIRGNCLADRAMLGMAGVFATGLAILGSFGLCSACGVKFTSIVGVVPFLVVGIGVDDMFILLSGMADAMEHSKNIEDRTAHMMRTSGLGITITSLTDLFGFLFGSLSIFRAVQYFCIYAGVSIIICYINHVTFFTSCIVLDQKRIAALRHSKTCATIKLRDELEAEGAGKVRLCCCGGSIPQKREDVESPLESFPRNLFTKLSLYTPLKPVVFLLLFTYWGFSVWGAIFFEEGLLYENLVHKDSYYHKYSVWNREDFDMGVIIMFVIDDEIDYTSIEIQHKIQDLLTHAKKSKYIDSDFQLSWLQAYSHHPLFNTTSQDAFVYNLKLFLNDRSGGIFKNDVVFSEDIPPRILASRIYAKAVSTVDQETLSKSMVTSRDAAQAYPLPVFAYAPMFVVFEQFVNILPQTIQTLAVVAASIFVVTFIFMPHPFTIVLVTVAVASMMTGLIGFMYFWNLTLSSITMIHIIMSVGFSVDYSAHICHAFMISKAETRAGKVRSALRHSGGPVCSGALSTFVGIVVLIFTNSYIFQSFFKVMLFVIVCGTLHALLILPVIMSLIGPLSSERDRTNDTRSQIISLGDFRVPRPSINLTYVSSKDSGIEKDANSPNKRNGIGL